MRPFFSAAIAASLFISVPAIASQVILNASNAGWYDNSGFHDSNPNDLAGSCSAATCGTAMQFRNFSVFDLSAVSGTVVAAEFRPYEPAVSDGLGNGYASVDPTETYTTFDVSTPPGTVIAGGTGLTAIFADLGTGTSYGAVTTSNADNGSFLTVALNRAAVAAINGALGGSFAIGGSVTSILGGGDQLIFGFTGATPNQLVLTISDCASGPVDVSHCLIATSGKLQISDSETAGKDKLSWQWGKGEAFAQADVGAPDVATTYKLCVFDQTAGVSSVKAELDIAASATTWVSKAPKGVQYKDKEGTSDGVTKAQIKTGADGKTQVKISAATANLTLPVPLDATKYFDQDASVIVQLVGSTGTCWTSSFGVADTTTNVGDAFKAQVK